MTVKYRVIPLIRTFTELLPGASHTVRHFTYSISFYSHSNSQCFVFLLPHVTEEKTNVEWLNYLGSQT